METDWNFSFTFEQILTLHGKNFYFFFSQNKPITQSINKNFYFTRNKLEHNHCLQKSTRNEQLLKIHSHLETSQPIRIKLITFSIVKMNVIVKLLKHDWLISSNKSDRKFVMRKIRKKIFSNTESDLNTFEEFLEMHKTKIYFLFAPWLFSAITFLENISIH